MCLHRSPLEDGWTETEGKHRPPQVVVRIFFNQKNWQISKHVVNNYNLFIIKMVVEYLKLYNHMYMSKLQPVFYIAPCLF